MKYPGKFSFVCYSPNGKEIASICGDNTVVLWDIDQESIKDIFNYERAATMKARLYHGNENLIRKKNGDIDGDGVSNKDDECPTEYGSISLLGCPDTDNDGIPDMLDLCITEPGSACTWGCPDIDGDCIPDRWDRCFTVPGTLENQGCPESINDTHKYVYGYDLGIFSNCQYSPKGGSLLIASGFSAMLWDMNQVGTLKLLTDFFPRANAVAFDSSGKFAAVATTDNKVKVWDINKGIIASTSKQLYSKINMVSYSPDGLFIAIACSDGTLTVANSATGDYLYHLTVSKNAITSVSFSPDSKFIVTSSSDNIATIYHATSGTFLRTLVGHNGCVWSAMYSPDGRYIVTASSDKTAKIWNARSGSLLYTITGHKDKVRSAVYSPDGKYIVTASCDSTARIWDISSINNSHLKIAHGKKQVDDQYTADVNSPEQRGLHIDGEESFLGVGDYSYHALIIEEQNYADKNLCLKFPIANGDSLQQLLKREYNFKPEHITCLKNPTRKEIIKSLDILAKTLSTRDHLLIFYAGHGYYDPSVETGYWMPSDADMNEKDLWVSNKEIITYIAGIKTTHTLLISDACFAGTILEDNREVPLNIGIDKLLSKKARMAMTSGLSEPVPDKSIFFDYLFEALKKNRKQYITTSELFFNDIYEPVRANTHNIPQCRPIIDTHHAGGDFIFFRP